MSAALCLEVLLALALQSALLILIASWLERLVRPAERDRFWFVTHAILLMITTLSFLMPHPRWVSLTDWVPGESRAAMQRVWGSVAWVTVAIYGVGVAWRATALGMGGLLAVGRDRAAAVSDNLTTAVRAQFPTSLFARRQGVVRIANGRGTARCWRWQRPMIVLSRRLMGLPPAERNLIVRHELAHLEADHPLHAFVQRCLEALFWFHPLMRRSARRAELARELHCDAQALGGAQDPREYLRVLLAIAERPREATSPVGALAFAPDTSTFQQRIAAVGSNPHAARSAPLALPALTLAAILLVCLGWPPVNPFASARECWSPWPTWSTTALRACGLSVRDYEADAHRLTPHHR